MILDLADRALACSISVRTACLRARVPELERDRVLAPDIEAAAALVREGILADL